MVWSVWMQPSRRLWGAIYGGHLGIHGISKIVLCDCRVLWNHVILDCVIGVVCSIIWVRSLGWACLVTWFCYHSNQDWRLLLYKLFVLPSMSFSLGIGLPSPPITIFIQIYFAIRRHYATMCSLPLVQTISAIDTYAIKWTIISQ